MASTFGTTQLISRREKRASFTKRFPQPQPTPPPPPMARYVASTCLRHGHRGSAFRAQRASRHRSAARQKKRIGPAPAQIHIEGKQARSHHNRTGIQAAGCPIRGNLLACISSTVFYASSNETTLRPFLPALRLGFTSTPARCSPAILTTFARLASAVNAPEMRKATFRRNGL